MFAVSTFASVKAPAASAAETPYLVPATVTSSPTFNSFIVKVAVPVPRPAQVPSNPADLAFSVLLTFVALSPFSR